MIDLYPLNRDEPKHCLCNRIGLIIPLFGKILVSEKVLEFVFLMLLTNVSIFNYLKVSRAKDFYFLHSVYFMSRHFNYK